MPTYTPLTWEDEIPGETPVKYVITGDVEGEISASAAIELATAPTAGTPVNATNMNHIEQGIEDAQDTANTAQDTADTAQDTANTLLFINRQGGDPASWIITGATNYLAGYARIQCGKIDATPAGLFTITFPEPFSNTPLGLAVANTTTTIFASVAGTTASDMTVMLFSSATGLPIAGVVTWLAIGPA